MAAKKTSNKKVACDKSTSTSTSAKGAPAMPSSAELAAMFGVTVQKRMKPREIWGLRKALPGYAAMLDDAAEMLEAEGAALQIPGLTPADLLEAQQEVKYLAAREAVLFSVYRSVYEQRLKVDDRAMKMLEKLARRVSALDEDDHTLAERWKLLLDFLSTFRRGGSKKAEPAEEEVDMEEEAAPAEEGE